MRQIIKILVLMLPSGLFGQRLLTPFELNQFTTATYDECIRFYRELDRRSPFINMTEAGASDAGHPVHLVIVDRDGLRKASEIRRRGRAILLINNGIHPGEPEGIDASMMLARDLANTKSLRPLLEQVSVVIVPVYNIGGCLRRNNTSRTNQNGPLYYGFRGNNNYLDLNRDFVKQDSRNARTFADAWQQWQPDVFIDTHTTDGADYPYAISILPGMRGKLGKTLGDYLYEHMLPALYQEMQNDGEEMIPYVEFRDKPEDGMYAFYDKPRFSSGYAALYHSFPFVIETHMLKPFKRRVDATYLLLEKIIRYTAEHRKEMLDARTRALEESRSMTEYPVRWRIDLTAPQMMLFNHYGTKSSYYPTLCDSLYCYDPEIRTQRSVPYYENYLPELYVRVPEYYVIPQAYFEVIDNLRRNGVRFTRLTKDTAITGSFYRLGDFKTVPNPYENHYLHTQLGVQEELTTYPYLRGDVLVPVRQDRIQYILQTLEPQGEDSFFAWNFFDGVLMRKEYYSDYAFAPVAEEEMKKKPELALSFREYLRSDSTRNRSMSDKLEYVYYRSRFSEPYYKLYPVARISGPTR